MNSSHAFRTFRQSFSGRGTIQLPNTPISQIIRRSLSSSQVSTALRPFYFLVHPDLFGRWPQEQAVNEASLKQLKSYLNVMLDEKRRPQPLSATFYVKPRHTTRKTLSKIQLKLGSEGKVRKTISSILKLVDLPTSYVDSIPDTEVDLSQAHPIFYYTGEDDTPDQKTQIDLLHRTDIRRPLPRWLRDNVENAQEKMAKSEPIRLETERLQDTICRELDLVDVQWESCWEISFKRGVLASFQNLLKAHEVIKDFLSKRILIFGLNSGMTLDGQIILYTGEVRTNWLNVIRNIPNFEHSLKNIPLVEKALSQNLRNIKIVHRKIGEGPLRLVDDYKRQLMRLVTNISDYLARQKLPKHWPETLDNFELCVDNESSPLTMSASGQFLVPASCPGFLLIPFINENMDLAKEKMARVKGDQLTELTLMIKCINQLGLIQLDRDDSLDTNSVIECCTRLLKSAPDIRHLTHGNHILVTRYYSVNSDGIVCIPWNWKLTLD